MMRVSFFTFVCFRLVVCSSRAFRFVWVVAGITLSELVLDQDA
jgi:hypothetical protein